MGGTDRAASPRERRQSGTVAGGRGRDPSRAGWTVGPAPNHTRPPSGLGGKIEKGWAAVSTRLDWVGTQFSNGTNRIERVVFAPAEQADWTVPPIGSYAAGRFAAPPVAAPPNSAASPADSRAPCRRGR